MKIISLPKERKNKVKKCILDTNCFLRLFLNDIPEQANQVEEVLEQAKKKKVEIFVPQIILFELHFALEKYYHFPKDEVIDKLKTLVATEYLKVESQEIFSTALTLYTQASTSFVDCFLLAQSQKEKAELFTFDQKLRKSLA